MQFKMEPTPRGTRVILEAETRMETQRNGDGTTTVRLFLVVPGQKDTLLDQVTFLGLCKCQGATNHG